MTTSIAHQAKSIVQNLNGIFPAFTASSIGSDDYKDKAMTVHGNVTALAQIHPNWSDEKKTILSHTDEAPQLRDDDLFILIYDCIEGLHQAWRDMRVTRPSIRSLSQAGTVFQEILDTLHTECEDLTNRRAARLAPAPADITHAPSCTCSTLVTPVTDATTN